MLDKRIGKYHDYDPLVCAVSERPIQSGAKGYPLNDQFFVKVNPGKLLTPDLLKQLTALVTPKRTSKKSSEDES